jgi:hypothetical protein
MTDKHTQGKWEVEKHNPLEVYNANVMLKDLQKIAVANSEANAQLIASAPCLLEACVIALDYLEATSYLEESNTPIKQLTAAIKQAKGE